MAKKLVCPKCGGDIIEAPKDLDPVRCSVCKAVILRVDLKEVEV